MIPNEVIELLEEEANKEFSQMTIDFVQEPAYNRGVAIGRKEFAREILAKLNANLPAASSGTGTNFLEGVANVANSVVQFVPNAASSVVDGTVYASECVGECVSGAAGVVVDVLSSIAD